ncbi:MAG: methyltransferase domain-containing protein [Saprospiraceae bacterium]|jgi:SAM-dependent methyltransferase
MHIPIWKRWLSHISPISLEEASTDLNPQLEVRLDKGRLQLLSGNAIYSWDDLYRNFTIAFEKIELPEGKDVQVLLLGLGLGSVPLILEQVYGKIYHYTAVEYDEAVSELALRYTLSRLNSPVELVVADASIYMDLCEEKFDLLIVDIFEDHITPAQFETAEFLDQCLECMKPGGQLLYNRLYQSAKDKEGTNTFYEEIFSEVFPQHRYLDTNGNWILIGSAAS